MDPIVTFLFTDVVESTQLWERYPADMRRILMRHNTLLTGIVRARNGRVFKTMGDACCAVFAHPTDALLAALDGQRALLEQDWGAVGALPVRMALHTGPAEKMRNDYLGLSLHHTDRLLKIGDGGQILLSEATSRLVESCLPAQTALIDLGAFRLKGLQRQHRIFALRHPALPLDRAEPRWDALRLDGLLSARFPRESARADLVAAERHLSAGDYQ
ncbi:MAG TPA: adenylate/guanylate cyclase domain-containing protein [Chthonomonadaceae bacterium]|nr:adenylate/guanylate cyclase domain-containing protein [Chthonomonadaceae bacterium]